ncbi:class I SAM-dependent methyltransferase [Kineococcus gynurae]|uniref:Class I SAM-dependent methyltransferase n=1 Tax=Kineococcus gynurae TaxID=452979 RepID=A0ABV5LW05_9ACTN
MSRGPATLLRGTTPPTWRYDRLVEALTPVLRGLGSAPLRVLDVGGGAGRDAVALARLGHEVLVLDTSARALAQAHEAADRAGVADRIRTVDADLEDLTTLAELTRYRAGGSGSFDLVCCHDVLGGRGSAEQVLLDLATVSSSVRPGGVLSLLGPVRPARGELGLDPDVLGVALLDLGLHEVSPGELLAPVGERGTPFWHLTARRA